MFKGDLSDNGTFKGKIYRLKPWKVFKVENLQTGRIPFTGYSISMILFVYRSTIFSGPGKVFDGTRRSTFFRELLCREDWGDFTFNNVPLYILCVSRTKFLRQGCFVYFLSCLDIQYSHQRSRGPQLLSYFKDYWLWKCVVEATL